MFEHFANIITSASESTLGLVALMVLVIAIIAYVFFKDDGVKTKLFVFILLFVSASSFTYSAIQEANPIIRTTPLACVY